MNQWSQKEKKKKIILNQCLSTVYSARNIYIVNLPSDKLAVKSCIFKGIHVSENAER